MRSSVLKASLAVNKKISLLVKRGLSVLILTGAIMGVAAGIWLISLRIMQA